MGILHPIFPPLDSKSFGLKVRYSLRSACAPIILAGSLAWLSESALAAALLGIPGVSLAVMIGLRPYARIRGRQAHYVSLISDKLCTSANVDDVVDAAKRLRWFLRRSDVRVLEQYRAQLD